MRRKGNPPILWMGMWNWCSTMEKRMEDPQKEKTVAIHSNDCTPEHICRQNSNLERHVHPTVHWSTIYYSQDMKEPKCPSREWIKKMWSTHTHTHNTILLSCKKQWNIAICRNMDGPRDWYTKWSKSERERQISYDITYMWNLKKNYTNETFREQNRFTDFENKLMVTKGERCRGGIN